MPESARLLPNRLLTSPRTGSLSLPLSDEKLPLWPSKLGSMLFAKAGGASCAALLVSLLSARAVRLFFCFFPLGGVARAKRSTNCERRFSSRLSFLISPRCMAICCDRLRTILDLTCFCDCSTCRSSICFCLSSATFSKVLVVSSFS